jgi:transposase
LHRRGLSYGDIPHKTGQDRRTVKKYADNPELMGRGRVNVKRASILDPFVDVIKSWLADDDQYQASWILDQIRKLGYTDGYTIVKDLVREIKQENGRIAYLRSETEPRCHAQVDFEDFKAVEPDGSERTLYEFSTMLGFSRTPYCEFLERCDMTSFLDAHQKAFAYFGGITAEILYDRMKNVFIGKVAGKTQFAQGLMTLAEHHGFVRKVAPAFCPWVKGACGHTIHFTTMFGLIRKLKSGSQNRTHRKEWAPIPMVGSGCCRRGGLYAH